MSVRQGFIFLSITSSLLLLTLATYWPIFYWGFAIIGPLILYGIHHMLQTKHTILRLYPVIGIFRYLFESIRPEIQQYFVESNINGRPINREFRALVYQRAKNVRDTRPFGTQFDVYRAGYEWMDHSMKPTEIEDKHPRVKLWRPRLQQTLSCIPAQHLRHELWRFEQARHHGVEQRCEDRQLRTQHRRRRPQSLII